MRNFQIIVLGIFAFFIVAGVIAFATFRGGNADDLDPVVVWGTLPADTMDRFLNQARNDNNESPDVSYREIRESAFDDEFVEAIASGRGPDMVLLSQDRILRHQDKVITIPFESYPERDFKDKFIEEGELYVTPGGIIGLPFSVDPLVLYWNRGLFSSEGLSRPPSFWDEFVNLVPRLTQQDERGNIVQSTVALGEFSNVQYAKDILSALVMQAGSPIIRRDGDRVESVFSQRLGFPEIPAEAALRFYTEFANPVRPVYSWNRSLPASQDAFLLGDLAMYIGYTSDLEGLSERNPNLNFDVAQLPQARGSNNRMTFGKMRAFAIVRTSPFVSSSFAVARILTNQENLALWSEVSGLPPVDRTLLAEAQTDAYQSVFYDSAIIARAFLDPDPKETTILFQGMIEDVTSGRARIGEVVFRTDDIFDDLLR